MHTPTNIRQHRYQRRETILLTLTGLPTAAGHEDRVNDWVIEWVRNLKTTKGRALVIDTDTAGNVMLRPETVPAENLTLVFTAHTDHPAFVVDAVLDDTRLGASFRGGVMAPYFDNARVRLETQTAVLRGTVVGHKPGTKAKEGETLTPEKLFRTATIRLDAPHNQSAAPGDVAVWDLPEPRIKNGCLETPVCDDLAAMAAALCAIEEAIADGAQPPAVGVLLTRAEEVGFVGAIAACRQGTVPAHASVLVLENSRASSHAPLGAGPIVRVGDRMTVFSPTLTARVQSAAKRLDQQRKEEGRAGFRWQRKLMDGGACEATAYCAYGIDATCVCLPLENYHNMGELDRVETEMQALQTTTGNQPAPGSVDAQVAPERVAVQDFHGLVDLLVACAQYLPQHKQPKDAMERLYNERAFLLEQQEGTNR